MIVFLLMKELLSYKFTSCNSKIIGICAYLFRRMAN